ncbi:DUF885 family protein [Metamycoplasma hyosynoviae]|uniref:DUF885 family protein n=1 Tax=Metamycoplasma hyosynoviae TaxID=29559 RepID=UPI002358C0ED|nr:DUF885 family protein [Metamycoplasma hyosynoviae]MDC8937719.1 DUF885 family protein [Metamycoplasma hyosynoviae]
MKQKNKVLFSTLGLVGGGILGILPTALLAKKCGDKKGSTPEEKKITYDVMKDARRILEIKKESEEAMKKANIYLSAPTEEEAKRAVTIIDEQLAKINTELAHYLKKDLDKDINPDVLAWVKGIKYNLELQRSSFTSGIRYLLAKFEYGPGGSYLASGDYQYSPIPWNDKDAERQLVTLKDAVRLKIVPSKVFIKNGINQIVKQVLLADQGSSQKLDEFISGSTDDITLTDLIDATTKVSAKRKEFFKYYVSEYYNSSDYGKGENIDVLKLSKKNDTLQEKENTIVFKKTTNLYGVGLTDKDLKEKEVGIGFMKVSDEAKKMGISGKSVYDHLLKMCTTSDLSDQDVFTKGYNTSKAASENMTEIAKRVATLLTGSPDADWKPKIRYDANGSGSITENYEVKVRENKQINLSEFIKWLNQEPFFFGREKSDYYTSEVIKDLTEGDYLKPAREELKKSGYDHLITDENKGKQYRGITNGQFYYGGLEGFKAYYQFKSQTQKYGQSFFEKIVPDYGVQTYNFSSRANNGVGAYNTGRKNFLFNTDPYYGLQKWSVTSFANHESMMGHHNQLMYALYHINKIKDKDGEISLPVTTFRYTSFLEGWALFMEWFGIEAKFYGTPDYASKNLDTLPVDFGWDKSYGITSFLKNAKVDWTKDDEVNKNPETKQMKELHGGIYYNIVKEAGQVFKTEGERIKAAAKLANLLQYFGALNEAQLRNMRLLIDTGYHGASVTGVDTLKQGWSIQEARDYMKNNSALGHGDIESESKRYLNFVGQATSYNSGKEILKDLYEEVRTHLKLSREEFINHNDHQHPKKFFDIVLRNSALPMDAVAAIVRAEYGIKK